MKVGALYDILYQGLFSFIGFFAYEPNDKGRIGFFCFNVECQGDYLYFPVDEVIVMERDDTNLAAIARAVYEECNRMKWLIEVMGWGTQAEFLVKSVLKKGQHH